MFNLFKKYKRSLWMSGLLSAERYIQNGYVLDTSCTDRLRLYRGDFGDDIDWITSGTHYEGVKDYLDYYENNLRNI
jgi:hypothetical protein